MIKYRLINCDFLNATTFLKLSNKAKLLYYAMLTSADDLGFVSNCDTIIETLVKTDDGYENAKLLGLEAQLQNDYVTARIELLNKTYVYVFQDKHQNEIYVIKHWFLHNRFRDKLLTNYKSLYRNLEIIDGEYYLKGTREKHIREKNLKGKESKVNESKRKNVGNNATKEIIKEKIDNEWNQLMNEIDTPKESGEDE